MDVPPWHASCIDRRQVLSRVKPIPEKPGYALHQPNAGNPAAAVASFYRRVLGRLNSGEVRFLIGGGYALEMYTPVRRPTKDIDLFVLPGDVHRVFGI